MTFLETSLLDVLHHPGCNDAIHPAIMKMGDLCTCMGSVECT